MNTDVLEKLKKKISNDQLELSLCLNDKVLDSKIIDVPNWQNKFLKDNEKLSFYLKKISDSFEKDVQKRHYNMLLKDKLNAYEYSDYDEHNIVSFKLKHNDELVQQTSFEALKYEMDIFNYEGISFYYFLKDSSNNLENFLCNL